ncbi:MAG: crossover junction endodeoxyribonuclease RuvC [candidate division WOR-3 bacterium]
MKVIGFDPSLKQTGYAIVNDSLKIITAGIIKTDSEEKFENRLYEIFYESDSILQKFKPEFAVFEESFYHKNVKTTSILSMVRSALIVSCVKNGTKIKFFSPNLIKKSVTGRGHSTKEQVQFMVKTIFKIEKNLPYDVSDALAVTYTFLNRKDYELVH